MFHFTHSQPRWSSYIFLCFILLFSILLIHLIVFSVFRKLLPKLAVAQIFSNYCGIVGDAQRIQDFVVVVVQTGFYSVALAAWELTMQTTWPVTEIYHSLPPKWYAPTEPPSTCVFLCTPILILWSSRPNQRPCVCSLNTLSLTLDPQNSQVLIHKLLFSFMSFLSVFTH